MTKKLVALLALTAAIGLAGRVWPSSVRAVTSAVAADADRGTSASQQLPDGLRLPVADVNLRIASLVTADLDADGDIDVLATENSSGSIKIVVWVNGGDGRLARKEPLRPSSSGFAPDSSSVGDGQSASLVTIQSDGYALAPLGVSPWMSLGSQPYRFATAADPVSVSPGTLRSRSPPALLRLS